jgi:hypothetical protein
MQDEHLLHTSVSNQSFVRPVADLDVSIDDRRIFHQQMTTGTQHNWASVNISVAEGEHTLVATEAKTQSRQAQVVNVERELWIVVTFQSPPDQIRVEIHEDLIGFM